LARAPITLETDTPIEGTRMPFFAVALAAMLVVVLLSRDHDLSASQSTVLTAELHLDGGAVSVFPDRIHLSRCAPSAFGRPDEVKRGLAALRAEGFAGAESFAIDELPGVCVALAVNSRDAMTAVIYDHVRAGVWVEIVSRYRNGTRWTHTTLGGHGFATRPGNVLVALPGASVAELLGRARGDRPQGDLRPVGRLDAAPVFEQGYADWIAWRKLELAGDAEGELSQAA
jgi:hypothetical protein